MHTRILLTFLSAQRSKLLITR